MTDSIDSGSSIPELPDDFGADLVDKYREQIDPGDEQLAADIASMLADPTVPESVPAESPAEQPADSAETLPPPEPGTEQQPPAAPEGGYVWTWTEGDQAREQRFDDEQVRQALAFYADRSAHEGVQLLSWANSLTPEARRAMGEVAEGQAVAVARADWDRYQAWMHSQQTAARLPADIDQYDPDAARLIREQAETIARLEGRPAQPISAPAAPAGIGGYQMPPDVQARGAAQALDEARAAWRLNDDEARYLYQAALPHFAPLQVQNSTFNPVTGQLMTPADPADSMRRALRFALSDNPQLYEAVVARTQQPDPDQISEAVAQTQSASVTDIAAKRARAASLAAAPSNAVTPSPRSVHRLTDGEYNALFEPGGAVTEELTRAMYGTGA